MTGRPPFLALPHSQDDVWKSLESDNVSWIPVCSCEAGFNVEMFASAVKQLVHHPEYNSTLILRSEVIEENIAAPDCGAEAPSLNGFQPLHSIRRRLLPRRPGRDPAIDQDCTFYAEVDESHGLADRVSSSCLVLTPLLSPESTMPFYHPAVFHLAFRYLHRERTPGGNGNSRIRIEIVPQPGASDPKDINSRMYRTCIALLETVHRYGWGFSTNYQKQVFHDLVVSREEYQDLYLVLREKYKHLVDQWHENTDPLKHVFEDIGIATFLMLLWKQGPPANSPDKAAETERSTEGKPPWHSWSRPREGFLDLGCGNGLLVHILVSEGYSGHGIDLRARTSWTHYPPESQARLHVHALDPLDFDSEAVAEENPYLRPGTFIIANHADELSPWTPVLATLTNASGFLSIPCCPWSFDAKFHRSQLPLKEGASEGPFSISLFDGVALQRNGDETEICSAEHFIGSLRLSGLGGDVGKSAYAAYRVWLAALGVQCGWEAETETLRIPSTRNWSLVGRRRCGNEKESKEHALGIIRRVKERGIFRTRKPEGKAGEH